MRGVLGWDGQKVLVRATKKERTRESARHFLRGLYGIDMEVPPSPDEELDTLLRFYKNCPKYSKDVLDNEHTYEEKNKIEETDAYVAMVGDRGDSSSSARSRSLRTSGCTYSERAGNLVAMLSSPGWVANFRDRITKV